MPQAERSWWGLGVAVLTFSLWSRLSQHQDGDRIGMLVPSDCYS